MLKLCNLALFLATLVLDEEEAVSPRSLGKLVFFEILEPMGASLHPLLASLDLKGTVLESTTSSADPLWCKLLKAQAMRRRRRIRRIIKRPAGMSMRRRRVLPEGSRRPLNEMEKKVRTLKKLIPNGRSTSMGLDGLFRETAEYIDCLQMQVKVMQVMVKALSAGSDE